MTFQGIIEAIQAFTNEYLNLELTYEWGVGVFAILALILLILIWLILRSIRLWYWKVDKHDVALESIESKLDELLERGAQKQPEPHVADEALAEIRASVYKDEKPAEESVPEEAAPEKAETVEDILEETLAEAGEAPSEKPAETPKNINELGADRRLRCIGKSGRIYTEEELQELIKD